MPLKILINRHNITLYNAPIELLFVQVTGEIRMPLMMFGMLILIEALHKIILILGFISLH